jgi:hypothetical protein
MNIEKDQDPHLERNKLTEEQIINCEKIEELNSAWEEYEEKVSRKPARIIVEKYDKVQADTLPF